MLFGFLAVIVAIRVRAQGPPEVPAEDTELQFLYDVMQGLGVCAV